MKKILFIINTLNMGGAEHVLVDIVNQMVNDGFDVTVQTLIDGGHYENALDSRVHYRNTFPKTGKGNLFTMLKHCFYTYLPATFLGNILIRGRFSHIVAFVEGIPTKVVAGYRKKRVKKIAWIHTDLYTNYESLDSFRTQEKNKNCYLNFDKIVCVSEGAKEGYIQRFGEQANLYVQYNPINKEEIIAKSQVVSLKEVSGNDVFRLVSVGRVTAVKGFDLLLDALVRVKQDASKPVEFYLVGDGDQLEELRRKSEALKLNDTVFFCGRKENPYEIMSQCDMQIISSRAEGYSLALCEGLLLKLPAVSTRCVGPTELITESKTGILVDISSDALAEGICLMINDEELYRSCKKQAEKWSEAYDPYAVFNQIEALFD